MTSGPNLLCRLFGHRQSGEPVWNRGFYFATCRRCAEDIVRIPGEKWHRPRNARVVWSKAPAPSIREARLQRSKGAALASWSELPAHTRISGTAERAIRQGRRMPSVLEEQRRSAIPDFMDDPDTPLGGKRTQSADPHATGPWPVPAQSIRVA